VTAPAVRLLGVDFSCAPSRKKPITVARGVLIGRVLRFEALDALPTLAEFEALLREPGPWLGAFDFPFGLPREFVDSLNLGNSTDAVITELHSRCATRMNFRALVDGWGNERPKGQRLLHEGLSRLVQADVHLPRMRQGDTSRTALEGYPGLLAFELIGRRSYKNSAEPDRLIARKDMLEALEQGRTRLGLRLKLTHAQRDWLVDDASGDRLDAVLCLMQAAWASTRPEGGLPKKLDAVEGWIATVP